MPTRILLVEEQQECCELFKRFLQRSGYDVTAVHDGIRCLEALNCSVRFDILILSWELPGGEGEAVLDWLRDRRVDDISVIILTARMEQDFRSREQAYAGVTWVQRPFRLLELLDAVRAAGRVLRDSWRRSGRAIRISTVPTDGEIPDSEAVSTIQVGPEGPFLTESELETR